LVHKIRRSHAYISYIITYIQSHHTNVHIWLTRSIMLLES